MAEPGNYHCSTKKYFLSILLTVLCPHFFSSLFSFFNNDYSEVTPQHYWVLLVLLLVLLLIQPWAKVQNETLESPPAPPPKKGSHLCCHEKPAAWAPDGVSKIDSRNLIIFLLLILLGENISFGGVICWFSFLIALHQSPLRSIHWSPRADGRARAWKWRQKNLEHTQNPAFNVGNKSSSIFKVIISKSLSTQNSPYLTNHL